MIKGLNYDENKTWEDFLHGRISARTAAETLKISHQQIMNRTCSLFRRGLIEGHITVEGELELVDNSSPYFTRKGRQGH